MKIKLSNFFALPYFIPLFAIALRVTSAPTASLSYFVLAAYALQGRVHTIQALTLSWLFSMLSAGVVPSSSDAGIGRYVVLIAATVTAFRFGFRGAPVQARNIVKYSLLFGVGILIHSFLFSLMTDVSVLKVISWMMAMGSLIMVWSGLTAEIRIQLIRQIFSLITLVMIFSLPLVFLPTGYLINGTGFQGVLGHPQAFGTVMGLLGAWSGGTILTSEKPSLWLIGHFALSLVMILMSEARTGALSLILAFSFTFVMVTSLSGQRLLRLAPGLSSIRLHLVTMACVVMMVLLWPQFSERISYFFSKRTDSQSLAQAYDASRGELMDAMWTNIKKDPFIGIGFGIGSNPNEMIITRDPILDIPVSAIVEKGVLPIAIFEELGIVGFIVSGLWFFTIIRRSAYGGLTPLAVCLTAMLQNMGDSMFFSASGMGLILIILVAWAATFTRKLPENI